MREMQMPELIIREIFSRIKIIYSVQIFGS